MSTGVIFILGKGVTDFWLMGSNQPGRRGHPRLGFHLCPFKIIKFVVEFLLCLHILRLDLVFTALTINSYLRCCICELDYWLL